MLSDSQLNQYQTDGYVLLEGLFTPDQVDAMESEFEELVSVESPALIREDDSNVVRGHHGAHMVSALYADLVRDRRLLDTAKQVLKSDVYGLIVNESVEVV